MNLPTMKLTQNERIILFLEGIITLGTVFLIYLSLVLLYLEFLKLPMTWFGEPNLTTFAYFGWSVKDVIMTRQILSYIMIMIAPLATYSRVNKIRNSLHLKRVLDYLKYISNGHYDLKIPEVNIGELTDAIHSINSLVESVVQSREEERKVEQSKDELIANVGHDLRTPLTSIIGYLGLINNQQYQSEEQMLNYASIAYNKALDMNVLVNDLFDYAASRMTSYKIRPIEMNIGMFFEQLAADFELLAQEKNIKIEIDVTPEELIVSLDPEKMARVFHNLISNALKYGHGASLIQLRAYRDLGDRQTILEVRNNGELIPESELENIFERSYRLDSSRNADVPGSGLGLPIVRNIVNVHNGKVHAEIDQQFMVFKIEMKWGNK
ncbi:MULTISPECIES: HAMP domain-containing sensor histidine kinase [unclassified Facklamia]|uniref:sensor histidine kinase n=1 Tax=Aerococcaceae TaxID=186827 RepID=UPI0013B9908D|nr:MULTISPECIES: HAMP domain-containing sensor histidine kinase [unclassified Facklamia]NEW65010.1 two-component sensor histidine kinase [Facklamia sp. 252]NEW68471.1 two-component sensor histidine kinase [Facklamia sp. 253]QQD65607.1 HAMP domain-containing histidine kinase [Aerococcaceae bacterium zg-252]